MKEEKTSLLMINYDDMKKDYIQFARRTMIMVLMAIVFFLPKTAAQGNLCCDVLDSCAYNLCGHVVFDENQNCVWDEAENGLSGWKIKANSNGEDYFSFTDEEGIFGLSLPTGAYTVEMIPPNVLWSENCIGSVTGAIDAAMDRDTVNFLVSSALDCALMRVDISTPILRQCSTAEFTISYQNEGTVTAENSTVEVIFDERLTVGESSAPILESDGNTYTYDIGAVAVNERGNFTVSTNVSCAVVVGQTLCTEAHITPDSLCMPFHQDWSGASIEVKGECTGDSVVFTIENSGFGDMISPGTYYVVEDIVVLFQANPTFQLAIGQSETISFPANGSTYSLRASQVPHHPGSSSPIATVEGCGFDPGGFYSVGMITQFPEDDNNPAVSIDCQEVRGLLDANEKIGYPVGIGVMHKIDRGQTIEYHIRFQNTGNDTVRNVVVTEEISPHLDLTSLQLGASSHPYTASFVSNILQFSFDDISLPESSTNEMASHGFVKFRISQQPDLPSGTEINNIAGIYFDFDETAWTNTTTHLVDTSFFNVLRIDERVLQDVTITAMPNPFHEFTIVRIGDTHGENGVWALYDLTGGKVKNDVFNNGEFQIQREGLSPGIYFLKLTTDGEVTGVGKLMIN